jgi:hypothetical protein
LARTKAAGDDSIDPQILGAEGDTCAQCGTKLAVDQRYCLNCGTPRTEPRLDYQRALAPEGGAAPGAGGAGQGQQAVGWTPLAAVVAIAILGGMLLLGVLIGQDDNSVTVTEVQQTGGTTSATTETSATTTTPTTTTETTPTETTPEATPGATTDDFGTERPDAGGVGAAP